MLFFSVFLSGFTLGIFAALKIFAPDSKEEQWDPQHFPVKYIQKTQDDLVSPANKSALININIKTKDLPKAVLIK